MMFKYEIRYIFTHIWRCSPVTSWGFPEPAPQSGQKEDTGETLADQTDASLCAPHWVKYPGVRSKKESNMENTKALAELVDNKMAAHYELNLT
ncbi:unnamed protein product [Arctogadus glacialis]